jgi:hypothetical protein
MSVAVTNWSDRQEDPSKNKCSPNLEALNVWLRERWKSSQKLGCYGERNVRGGTKPSAHSHGAALDVRYENPGPGRLFALATIQFVIANAEVFGIQAIHDYVGARIWHSDRNAWKAAGKNSKGAYTDPNMGHDWAQWFHFETSFQDWGNSKPINDRFAALNDPKPQPVPEPQPQPKPPTTPPPAVPTPSPTGTPGKDNDMLLIEYGEAKDGMPNADWYHAVILGPRGLEWAEDGSVTDGLKAAGVGRISLDRVTPGAGDKQMIAYMAQFGTYGASPYAAAVPNADLDARWREFSRGGL